METLLKTVRPVWLVILNGGNGNNLECKNFDHKHGHQRNQEIFQPKLH